MILAPIPIAPGIMLYRIVLNASKPKPRMMSGPKAPIPPETRDTQNTEKSQECPISLEPLLLTRKDETPLLDVEEALADLAPFEGGVLRTGVVESDSLKCEVLLLIGEETGGGDVRRKEPDGGDNTDHATVDQQRHTVVRDNSHSTIEQEDVLVHV